MNGDTVSDPILALKVTATCATDKDTAQVLF